MDRVSGGIIGRQVRFYNSLKVQVSVAGSVRESPRESWDPGMQACSQTADGETELHPGKHSTHRKAS